MLVDLAHCGRDDDEFGVLQPVFNASRGSVPPIDEIRAEVEGGQARIVTTGRGRGVVFETTYWLDEARPHALRLRSRLEREQDGDQVALFGDVVLHGNGTMSPFTLSTRYPETTTGFAHPPVDVSDPLAMLRAVVPADVHVVVGADVYEPGIAYGLMLGEARLVDPDGSSRPLPHASINGEHFTTMAVFTRPFWYEGDGPPGWLQLLQGLLMDLDVGEVLTLERTLVVGGRGDAASVTDSVFASDPRVVGRVDDATARLQVEREDGTPITWLRPDARGAFAFRAPPGWHQLRIRAPGRPERVEPLELSDVGTDLGLIAIGDPARVKLPAGRAVRLVFEGVGDTPHPVFGDDQRGFVVGEDAIDASSRSREIALSGRPGDPTHAVLPAGSYRVIATRGLEYGVSEAGLSAVAGETVTLQIDPPERVVDSPGWISADLHVHAEPSDDSSLPLRRRVDSFVAQGAEVLVATDHDQITDYGPLLRSLGLTSELASVSGVEISATAVLRNVAPHLRPRERASPRAASAGLPLGNAGARGHAPPHLHGQRPRAGRAAAGAAQPPARQGGGRRGLRALLQPPLGGGRALPAPRSRSTRPPIAA